MAQWRADESRRSGATPLEPSYDKWGYRARTRSAGDETHVDNDVRVPDRSSDHHEHA